MYLTKDASSIVVPFRPDLATLIPHAKPLEHRGEKYLVVPNGHDEARLARNLGVPIPAPILTRYDWCGQKPWAIQKTTAALLTESYRAYVLNSMGTGKSRAALWAIDYLMKTGKAKRALIAAPLSTLTPVWESELFRVLPHRKRTVLYGTRDQRRQALANGAEIMIINHHGLHLLQAELIACDFDVVVIDELAVFRNRSTRLWKSANAVVERARFAWGMTGSPTPNAPTDAWAQVRLLTPGRTTRTMAAFQDLTMRRVSQFRWVARPEANDVVFTAMQPSVRYCREDIMELPDTVYTDREVQLSPEGDKAYKLLFKKMRMLTQCGKSISAVNEGVLQNKLLQVACGFIYTDTRTVYALPNEGRLKALDEVIAETDRKVIIFVPYIHALAGIAEHLQKKGHSIAVVNGATPRGARDKIFMNFQNAKDPRLLIAHPGCMSHGLTLTAANTIIWFAPVNSLEIYEQANARITRPGQSSKTLIAHLYGTPVERATYARLRSRAKMQGLLLALFRDQRLEF
jgi:SNF2 family DNA or RNA helicase